MLFIVTLGMSGIPSLQSVMSGEHSKMWVDYQCVCSYARTVIPSLLVCRSACWEVVTAARIPVSDLINQSRGSNTLGRCIGKACKLAYITVAANYN